MKTIKHHLIAWLTASTSILPTVHAAPTRGDFNGDGFADLAVGVPREDLTVTIPLRTGPTITQTLTDAGAVNVIYGSSGGLTATAASVPASQCWSQESSSVLGASGAHDRFGTALASGDFNADGFSDLAIAVPGESTTVSGVVVRGAVQVLYGSAVGLTAAGNQLLNLAQLFAQALTENGSLRVGDSLVSGDFNGDGFGDLAVEGQNVGPDLARVSVLFGSATGLNLGPIARVEFAFNNASSGDAENRFTALAFGAGRLNSDTYDDLVVGLHLADVAGVVDAGSVKILPGSATGPSLSASQTFSQNSVGVAAQAEARDGFGFALAIGDFTGDGIGDLAIGAPFEDVDRIAEGVIVPNIVPNAGVVHVLQGTSNGVVTFGNQLLQRHADANAEAEFGFALAAGRFNDDALADLAIGLPGEPDGPRADVGAVCVLYGQSGVGLSTTAGPGVQTWTEVNAGSQPRAAGDRFGESLSVSNFGRNQLVTFPTRRVISTADLAIGIPGKDVADPMISEGGGAIRADAGAVRVIYGSASGLSLSTGFLGAPGPSQLWSQISDGPEDGDRFGSSLD